MSDFNRDRCYICSKPFYWELLMFDAPAYLEKLSSGEDVDNPVLDFLGMKLEEFREGYVRFSMEIRSGFKQGMGVMQGGLTVAFADESAAHCAMTVLAPGGGNHYAGIKERLSLHGKRRAAYSGIHCLQEGPPDCDCRHSRHRFQG